MPNHCDMQSRNIDMDVLTKHSDTELPRAEGRNSNRRFLCTR
jgi:hypothetical protein